MLRLDTDSTESNTPQNQESGKPTSFKFPDDSTSAHTASNRSSNQSCDDFTAPKMPFTLAGETSKKVPVTLTPICEAPADQNLLPVFKKLMAPLEFLLFGSNMLFLAYYYFERDHLSLTYDSQRMEVLQMMATVDQLILFFFAMKVCLKFATKLNEILYEEEIRAANT